MGVPAYRRVGVSSVSCQMLLKTTDLPIDALSHKSHESHRSYPVARPLLRQRQTPAPLVTFLPILTIFGKTDALFYASVQYTGR